MKELDIKTIDYVANLARLSLSEEEKKMYGSQLSSIFSYIDLLNEVNTDSVEETCQVTGLEDVFREDEIIECSEEEKAEIIRSFPKKIGALLRVKAVFSESDETDL